MQPTVEYSVSSAKLLRILDSWDPFRRLVDEKSWNSWGMGKIWYIWGPWTENSGDLRTRERRKLVSRTF